MRHIIVRENAKPSEFVKWVNAMQEVCEGSRLGIPCIVASNSKNESSDINYDASKESNRFTTFPGTLGLAASRDMELIDQFAGIVHKEYIRNLWRASGSDQRDHAACDQRHPG
jgi:beta-glucosidase